MNVFNRQHRKRVELIMMLLVGLACGILLSKLFRRVRWHFSDGLLTVIRISDPQSCPNYTVPRSRASLTTTIKGSVAPPNHSFKETRILCMVPTNPKTQENRAIHIKHTWGARCNKLIFMSTKANKQLGAVELNVKEGSSNLWGKTRASMEYVYKHNFRKYDWFLKVDEYTYVVMENLRSFLNFYSSKAPVYFGSNFLRSEAELGYMSGGAGYVFSKEALHRFMKFGFGNGSICSNRSYGYEDLELGRCMQAVGVVGGDTRDEHGLSRFIPFSPLRSHPLQGYQSFRIQKMVSDACCSSSAISFHYSNPKDLYVLDYIIYKLKAIDLTRGQGFA
ncbi:hypothetical protein KR009_004219 [Drosophila setifemur]|nr:hypothetical protein KR009_004219 [Drosophila setifemur]